MAGRDWVQGFTHCNPMIAYREAQNLNPGRAQKLNHFIVNDYFSKLLDNNGRTRSNEQTRMHL
jgi:hypothetical protein